MSLPRRPLAVAALAVLLFPLVGVNPSARAARMQAAASVGAQEAAAAAPANPGFEEVFAQDTLIFLGIDDVATLRRDWAASAWGSMFADEKAAPVRDAFKGLLAALAAGSKEELGFDLVETAEMLTGRFGVAITGIVETDDSGGDLGDFHAVAAAGAGEHAALVRDRVASLFRKLVEREDAVLRNDTVGDVEVVTAVASRPADSGRMHAAAAGPTVAFGIASGAHVERDDFARFLSALAGEGKDTLSQLPVFRTSHAAQPGGVKLWIDTGALMRASMAGKPEDDPGAQMQHMLGLHAFGPLAARFALDQHEMRVEAHQAWGGGWLPKLLDAWFAGGDFSLLSRLPTEALMAMSLHLDLAAGFDATEAMRKELGSPPLFGGPSEGADPTAAAAEPPPDPKKDFLDHLDGRVAFFMAETDPTEAMPMLPSAKPMNFALVLGVKNAEALSASLDKVLRSAGLHAARRRSEFEGFQVYTIPILPFTVHYAIVDDLAVVSMSQTLLQDVLRRKSNQELPSLAADATFRRELEAMARPHALLLWTKTTSEMLAGAAEGAGFRAGLGPPGFDPDLFAEEGAEGGTEGGAEEPPSDSIEARGRAFLDALEALDPTLVIQHLPGGSILGIAADEQGLHLEGVSR